MKPENRNLGKKLLRKAGNVGFEPSKCAMLAKDFFLPRSVKTMLIPANMREYFAKSSSYLWIG
jgi:hypothetical protein